MATYQAVVAQTQSSSSSSNLCCSVATQTWSAHHFACSLLHTSTLHHQLMLCGAHLYSLHPKLRCVVHIFSHTQQKHACCTSLSPSIFPTCLFSTKNKLAKLKGLLRVQPNGRRKDEPQRDFISVRCMKRRPSWSLFTLGSKHACDKNRRSSVTYASISVFPPHPIPSSRTTKYVVCYCCLHIKSHSDLYSVPSNIRIGPTDANAFRGHRLTTQKGYIYATYKTRICF